MFLEDIQLLNRTKLLEITALSYLLNRAKLLEIKLRVPTHGEVTFRGRVVPHTGSGLSLIRQACQCQRGLGLQSVLNKV